MPMHQPLPWNASSRVLICLVGTSPMCATYFASRQGPYLNSVRPRERLLDSQSRPLRGLTCVCCLQRAFRPFDLRRVGAQRYESLLQRFRGHFLRLGLLRRMLDARVLTFYLLRQTEGKLLGEIGLYSDLQQQKCPVCRVLHPFH